MDYEKMYKEALERVRRLHDRMLVLSSTDALVASSELEFIFPELSKSEDERIREWLVNYFKAAGKSWIHRDISPEQILAYLEKQKEQKPSWSEEDEKMRDRLITRLNWITYNTSTNGTSPNITFFDEIAWLKSLRPQHSWKPSEEQMNSLLNSEGILRSLQYDEHAKNIAELYEQLKKL